MPGQVVLEGRRGGLVVERGVGRDLEGVAVDQARCPSAITFAPASSSACEVNGSQIAQASRCPAVNAASASAGWRFSTLTSLVLQAGVLQLGEQVVVGRAALGDADRLALEVGDGL